MPKPQPQAQVRLFCFPYAGGGAAVFRTWSALLATTIELCAIQLPGRENRLHEAPLDQLDQLVQVLGTVTQSALATWCEHTQASGKIHLPLGNHFFLNQAPLPYCNLFKAR